MESNESKAERKIQSKRGKDYWGSLMQQWQSTGMSQREFCESNNINYCAFREWKKKLLDTSPKQTAKLVKIYDNSSDYCKTEGVPEKCPQEAGVRIQFGDFCVEVKRDCSEEALLKVVRALRKA